MPAPEASHPTRMETLSASPKQDQYLLSMFKRWMTSTTIGPCPAIIFWSGSRKQATFPSQLSYTLTRKIWPSIAARIGLIMAKIATQGLFIPRCVIPNAKKLLEASMRWQGWQPYLGRTTYGSRSAPHQITCITRKDALTHATRQKGSHAV